MEADLLAELIARAFTALAGPRHRLPDAAASVPDGAGLFAIHGGAEAWRALGLGEPPAGTSVLFVARAKDALISRELPIHFLTGRTGGSDVRRTFAALLRDELGLRGLPRSQTRPSQLAEFALDDAHDAALSAWMTSYLEIAVWAQPPECSQLQLGEVEIAVLKRWSPPLNRRDTRSTWGARVTSALKLMAGDARAWAREHGHKL